jgi:NarL family two-component system response regulator LiaR
MNMKNGSVRVLVADDHAIVRMGLAALLGTEKDILVAGFAKNGLEAVSETLRLHPDVVVMDIMMPQKDGVCATREIMQACPETRIIILTSFGSSDGIAHALAAGACGAILKGDAETELVAAIRKVVAGEQAISDEIARNMEADPPIPELTPRQKDVLSSMVHGLTNRDIAMQLGIRQDGVNLHVNAILKKIGAANRTEAVAIALRKHLLKI